MSYVLSSNGGAGSNRIPRSDILAAASRRPKSIATTGRVRALSSQHHTVRRLHLMQEVSLYNIDQLILCVAESLQELDKVERHTHINHMVKTKFITGRFLWLLKHLSVPVLQSRPRSTIIFPRVAHLAKRYLSCSVRCWDSLCSVSSIIK